MSISANQELKDLRDKMRKLKRIIESTSVYDRRHDEMEKEVAVLKEAIKIARAVL